MIKFNALVIEHIDDTDIDYESLNITRPKPIQSISKTRVSVIDITGYFENSIEFEGKKIECVTVQRMSRIDCIAMMDIDKFDKLYEDAVNRMES